MEAGYNSFTLPLKKWLEKTETIGIILKGGRYGGAFADMDIAFEFASWISSKFKMYVIQDYKRRYITDNTFDAHIWQTIEDKQKFMSQIMTSKTPVRVAEDVDESSLNRL